MAKATPQPELKVGDQVPQDFSAIRGAGQLAYQDGVTLRYRRHFWYVSRNSDPSTEIVKHVCTSYTDGIEAYRSMIGEE